MTMKRCIVCSTPVISVTSNIDSYFFNCYQCGVFSIIDTAAADFADTFDREKRLLLSGWLRKNQEYTIQYNNFESLLKIRKPNIPDRANDLLLYISKICPDIGQSFNINLAFRTFVLFQDPKTEKLTEEDQKNGKLFVQMLSESWSKNWKELHWLINDYLILSNQYLKTGSSNDTIITPLGWAHLDSLRNKNILSEIVFIASKYEKSVNEFLDKYVVSAIEDAGYNPKLMRTHEHTNIIDDEMVSIIRQSKFLIADLTFNSRGAYYEAGFAHGLGLPVIFTCEESYFKNEDKIDANAIHFDTNHYVIREWVNDDGEKAEKFKKGLQHFITATYSQGTYKK